MQKLIFFLLRSFSGILAVFLFMTLTASAGGRFSDNGDGTVTDHKTGLMWSKSDNQGNISWHQAVKWVKYTFADTIASPYNDWRMPTLEELESLYSQDTAYEGYETDCGQKVKIVPEVELSCGWLWTSEKKNITARLYNFQKGYHYTDRMVKTRGYRVLPVRSLK